MYALVCVCVMCDVYMYMTTMFGVVTFAYPLEDALAQVQMGLKEHTPYVCI